MVSHWSLNDSKSPQVSRTLLSILTDINNAVVWMVSIRPLISKSSGPCTNPLVTVPIAPSTTGIIITFMFHSFFNSFARLSSCCYYYCYYWFYYYYYYYYYRLCEYPQSPSDNRSSPLSWYLFCIVVNLCNDVVEMTINRQWTFNFPSFIFSLFKDCFQ